VIAVFNAKKHDFVGIGSGLRLGRLGFLGSHAIEPISGHWEPLEAGFGGQSLQHCRGIAATGPAGRGASPARIGWAIAKPLGTEVKRQLIKKAAILCRWLVRHFQ
jgi:hypothetical protein